ncbi:MAG: flagellar hook-basal body protein [Chloroflexota bacterium]
MGTFGLWSAASGMSAQQTNVDIAANNLANVNTVGFERARGDFQDLLVERLNPAGGGLLRGDPTLHADAVGAGEGLQATKLMFEQGPLQSTNQVTDVAIDGQGFFQVQQPNGQIAYTRSGGFHIDPNGDVVDAQGNHLLVQTPAGNVAPLNVAQVVNGFEVPVNDLRLDTNGVLSGSFPGAAPGAAPVNFGILQLARFTNPQGLVQIGANLFSPSGNSGAAITGQPGTSTQASPGAPLLRFGQVWQRFLEGSNVNTGDELASVITAQRSYEMNQKSLQISDQMWQLANQMHQ